MLKNITRDDRNEIAVGINHINGYGDSALEKSSKDSQSKHFIFYYTLFNQLADNLLSKNPYPHKLSILDETMWTLPLTTKIISKKNKDRYIAFDYQTGEARSIESIRKIRKDKYINQAYYTKRDFKKSLESNNANLSSNTRIELGFKAIYAFYMVFLSITGMNDSTASTLKWSDEYLIEKAHQKFRNIKCRAGNKTVEFQIQKKFIKDFKKYIELRKFVLNGKDIDSLFFMSGGEKAYISSKQKMGKFSSYIGVSIGKALKEDLPLISSRKMRVNKTYQVVKKNGIVSASELAQSSKGTIIKAYLGESQNSADEELTKFYTALNKDIIFENDDSNSINIGQCRDYGNPYSKIPIKGVESNCVQSEGCLFCEHYGCHADKDDVRKLLSLLYIINECKYMYLNNEEYDLVYQRVIERIDEIITVIKNLSEETSKIVETIKYDVFENENLHYYWEHKLSMLIETGMIA